MNLEGSPIYTRVMRLTNDQWERSVTDILALGTPPGLSQSFMAPVLGVTDFSNNELVLTVNAGMLADYRAAAETVASMATESEAALARVYDGTDAEDFIATFGRRAHRRPLTDREKAKYQALFTTGSNQTAGTGTPFLKGARLVIRAMLQSPFFLYRTELGPGGAPLNGYELASKLSFWLRNTTPDEALLDAASAGEFDSVEGLLARAKSMLDEPAALETMRRFHRELLHFERFATISKVGVAAYKEEMNAELEQVSTAFFDRIFERDLGVKDILTSTIGFVGPSTAALYGAEAPASGVEERDLGPQRPGFFTQVPYLTLYSVNLGPDSIRRGVSINYDILCASLGVPLLELPPLPMLMPGQTNRERITTLTACGGECHGVLINPIGFAFENFDGLGQLRTLDNGKPIDTTGSYPFVEGTKSFADAVELMQIMADGTQAHACYGKKMASFTLQRDIVQADVPLVDTLKATSMAGSVKEIMLELVKNAAFRTRAGGTP